MQLHFILKKLNLMSLMKKLNSMLKLEFNYKLIFLNQYELLKSLNDGKDLPY